MLAACNASTRLREAGSPPVFAAVQDPTPLQGVTPVKMPMPAPDIGEQQPNSLWRTGSRTFFRDQRASRVGDILTVTISIDEKAQISNETKRQRDNTENAGIGNLLGFESTLSSLLPSDFRPELMASAASAMHNNGKGTVDRSEKINLRVAATVTQVLPNGNLVIAGRQQITVNFDMRELQVAGVIRPQDVSAQNTVKYDQIAEARVAYGGRGQLVDVQQPRYGAQLLDIFLPF